MPAACSPVGLEEVTQRTCRLVMPPSLASSSRLMACVCSGRPAMRLARALVDHDDGDVGEALALLLRAASDWRAPAAGRRATARAAARRGCGAPAAAPPARTASDHARPEQRAPAPSARSRSTSCSLHSSSSPAGRGGASALPSSLLPPYRTFPVLTAPAAPAGPARAPGRPCSCRSART